MAMLGKAVCSAPGKIILCGEHAVVYGKDAIACALDLRTKCNLMITKDCRLLQVSAECMGVDLTFTIEDVIGCLGSNITDFKKPSPAAEDVLANIHSFLEKFQHSDHMHGQTALLIILYLFLYIAKESFKENDFGLQVTITTDLPVGSGLGSSASYSTSIVASLLVLCGHLQPDSMKWSEEDKELICSWAYEAEKLVHGKPSGIDNSISTYGHALLFKSGQITKLDYFNNVPVHVLVINTKVPRSTKKLVTGVYQRHAKLPGVYDKLFDAIEAIVCAFKSKLQKLQEYKRDGAIEMYGSTICEMEHLIDINQNLLNSIGVGHEKLNEVVCICYKHDLHAKLTGAGGGGCAFAIIPPGFANDDLNAAMEVLQSRGFDCWKAILGGKGVALHEAVVF